MQIGSLNDSLLIFATKNGNIKAVEILLSMGANPNSCDDQQNTALLWAANNGHIKIVECLLKQGAWLDVRGYNHFTALTCAILEGREDIARLLLEQGASSNIRNNNYGNALDMAIVRCPNLIESILMHSAMQSLEEQAEFLSRVPNGPFPDIFSYTLAEQPSLIEPILERLATHPFGRPPAPLHNVEEIVKIITTLRDNKVFLADIHDLIISRNKRGLLVRFNSFLDDKEFMTEVPKVLHLEDKSCSSINRWLCALDNFLSNDQDKVLTNALLQFRKDALPILLGDKNNVEKREELTALATRLDCSDKKIYKTIVATINLFGERAHSGMFQETGIPNQGPIEQPLGQYNEEAHDGVSINKTPP